VALSEPAEMRLRRYCGRARFSRPDYADNGLGREARYLAPELRQLIWNDAEVRAVLLAAGDPSGFRALVAEVGHELGLPLLDLQAAMELEARTQDS